ncbi:MAG: hypothetical protein Kow0098_15820 [Ignavibacteriaceae bacterium]
MIKLKSILINILLFSSIIASQQNNTIKEFKYYRRTNLTQLASPEKYSQPKEEVFPPGYGTNHLNKVTSGTGVWTELNPKVPRVDYIGIDFINPDTGWACGGSGAIIKTTNGGDDWTIAETPVTNLLLKIHSYNGEVVICTGYDGLILRSSDSGETFEQVISGVGTGTDLWGVQMINDTLGWVCGLNQTLLKTTDAGLSWQQELPGLDQHYWSLDFLNGSYGMIACGGGIVLKTTDGGGTWIQKQAGDTRSLYTIDIIDSLHIAAGGASAGMGSKSVYSSDGGNTWQQMSNLIYESGVNCIAFVSTDTGYAVGENWAVRKTTNRGMDWFASDAMYTEWWIDILPFGNGYAAGNELKIYKTEGGYDNWERVFITDDFEDVYFLDEYKGFVIVKDPPRLYKTTDGGISWDSIPMAPGGVDLLFIDSLTGFIGASNSIYKTTDGGVSWYQTQGTTGAGKIFFINETTGWAIHSGTIYKTTDTGENWIEQHTTGDSYTSIYFIDRNNGWATSRYVWQTTDGGVNWVERTDIPAFFSNDVFFYNYLKGWVLSGNDLYVTIDNGINWTLDPQVYTYTTHFATISSTHFIITGTNIYESTDTGQVWQNITNLIGSYFTSLNAPKDYLAYGVGPQGYIVSYLDTAIIPVELVSFTVEKINEKIILNWTTATETNNYGFEVLRSIDSFNWETIGFVVGNGTTTKKNNYSFDDNEIFSDHYYYKLKQVDFDGSSKFSEILEIKILINKYSLLQNFPNPANPKTRITFSIPEKTIVKLNLYSITGELIKELVNEEKEKGIYQVDIDLSKYASGMYFYRMTTNSGYTATKKLIILK